ncbi:MAG: glycosyltransferase [Caldilineales bacterium]
MPAIHDLRRNATLTFVAPPLALWSDQQFRALPRLDPLRSDVLLPSLSIIIPARDEATNLLRLLPRLQRLRYPGALEIIVVDDGSTDLTAQLARAYGARVLQMRELPPGWLGKTRGCHVGASAASGDWLLFVDADTDYSLDGPARAVAHAERHGLDGLTVFLRQECNGPVGQLAMAVAYAGLFATIKPTHQVLNGQFVLLRRETYFESGGFLAVRDQPQEDLALGRHLATLGFTVPVFNGDDIGIVHMYRDTAGLAKGMARLGAQTPRWTGWRAIPTFMLVTALMSPLVTLIGVLLGQLDRRWLPATWLAATAAGLPWMQRFGSPTLAPAIPLAALFVQSAAVWGFVNRALGRGLMWKGRRV